MDEKKENSLVGLNDTIMKIFERNKQEKEPLYGKSDIPAVMNLISYIRNNMTDKSGAMKEAFDIVIDYLWLNKDMQTTTSKINIRHDAIDGVVTTLELPYAWVLQLGLNSNNEVRFDLDIQENKITITPINDTEDAGNSNE